MARIPIDIKKIKVTDSRGHEDTVYQFVLEEKGTNWQRILTCERKDLIRFKEDIEAVLASTTTADILSISKELAQKIDNAYQTDKFCKDCPLKLSNNCTTCIVIESPLERQLFLELRKSYVKFEMQYGLGHNGEIIDLEHNKKINNYTNVLTIVDFYIEKRDAKLCVYTDGHTYHERTEEQATRDRKIDRKLQQLGFTVLRYTGKDVREKSDKIISEIKNWLR